MRILFFILSLFIISCSPEVTTFNAQNVARKEIQDYNTILNLRSATLVPRKNDKVFVRETARVYYYDWSDNSTADNGSTVLVQAGGYRWKALTDVDTNTDTKTFLIQDSILVYRNIADVEIGRDTIKGTGGGSGGVGPPGPAGADGLSAYEIAVENGFVGDETEWLASLQGVQGEQGNPGWNGLSAYQEAVINGFVGDETEWLASLVGPQGPAGATGATGPQGPPGADGQGLEDFTAIYNPILTGPDTTGWEIIYEVNSVEVDRDTLPVTSGKTPTLQPYLVSGDTVGFILYHGATPMDTVQFNVGEPGPDFVDNYTELRDLVTDKSIINVRDWTYTGPDGKTYTTLGGVFKRVHTGSENGGTIIVADDGTIWERDWDKVNVRPEWWECGGYDRNGITYTNKNTSSDGIYNDADRLDNAARFVIAGNGSLVVLQKRLYEVDRPIGFVSTEGNGATVKTIRPVTTTNTVSYTAGQFTITVANASGYRVGMAVILTNNAATNGGAGYSENISGVDNRNYSITGISGNVITISESGTQSLGTGNTFSCVPKLGTINPNSRISNVIFDGNYDRNTITVDWRYTAFLSNGALATTYAGENAIHFYGCRFDKIIGVAFMGGAFGFSKCYADSLGGGILHYSASNGTSNEDDFAFVDGLEVSNCVLVNPYISVHNEALFTFSANTRNLKLSNIKVRNIKGAIFGYSLEQDHIFELSNSTFEGSVPSWASESTPFRLAYISNGASVSANGHQRSFRITNCSFNTCGDFIISGNNLEEGGTAANIYISGCKFNNVRINALNTTNLNITNNRFTNEPFSNHSAYTYRSSNSGFYSTAQIAVNWCDRVTIVRNYLEGTENFNQYVDYGIQAQMKKVFRKDSTGANTKIWFCSNIVINDNVVNRYSFGIGHLQRLDDAMSGWNAGHSTWGTGMHIGCEISRNIIAFHKDTQYDPTYRIIWGIMALQGTTVDGNTIYHPLNAPTNVMRSIVQWGINDAEKANLWGGIIRNNLVWSPTAINNIVIGTGAGGDDMEDNVVIQGNATCGAIYSTSGYITNNYRIQANAFAHLTTPYMNPDLNGFLQNKTQY